MKDGVFHQLNNNKNSFKNSYESAFVSKFRSRVSLCHNREVNSRYAIIRALSGGIIDAEMLVVVVLTVKVKSSLELICLAIHKHPTIDAFDFSLQVKCERREEFN
jgi:hypothetical protein